MTMWKTEFDFEVRGWRRLLAVGATVGLLGVGGCGDDDPMPPTVNSPPVAAISANPLSVPAGDGNQTVVTLDGTGSSDPDGDPLTFSWTVPGGTFVNGTSQSSAVSEVTFPGTAPYEVTLSVQDPDGATGQASVTIALGGGEPPPGNRQPAASITANPTSVPSGDNNTTVVRIDASQSTDPDGDQLSFQWTVPSGTFVQGTTNSDPTIQVTFPGAAPYTVTVRVSDGNGGEDQAQITIQLS